MHITIKSRYAQSKSCRGWYFVGKVTVLAPLYFKNFECIGSSCEDTCCKDWSISIDKKTYEKYRKIDEIAKKSKKTKFSPLAGGHITRHILKNKKKDTFENHYAQLNLVDGFCPFLDENHLCGIYKELGPQNMSRTCKIYPRSLTRFGSEYEISLTVSCPEVVRKALLNKDFMAFEYIETDSEIIEFVNFDFDEKAPEHKYLWDIRTNAITILQARKFDIVNRLILLGMMYEKIQKCIDENAYESIPDTINDFMSVIDVTGNSAFSKLKGNFEIQNTIYKSIFDGEFVNLYKSYKKIFYDEYMLPALRVIDENDETGYNDLKKIYSKYTKGEYSYILENYLVNEYFRTLMPFGKFVTLRDGLIKLCSDYTFIQGIALGFINQNADLNIDELVKIIYMFGRNFVHNQFYNKIVKANIKKWELDTLGGLYTLIF